MWLGLRRVHHDVGRPGRIFPLQHINIAPQSESAPVVPPPLSSRPQAPSDPLLEVKTTERVETDGKRIRMTKVSVRAASIVQWLAFAVGVVLSELSISK